MGEPESVPKIPIHKHDNSTCWKHNIWSTREVSHLDTVSKTYSMKRRTEHHFRLRITCLDA